MRHVRVFVLSGLMIMIAGVAFAPRGLAKNRMSPSGLAATAARDQANLRSVLGLTAGPVDCVGAAGNPVFGTPAWTERDAVNEFCATQRQADEIANPSFGAAFSAETPSIYASQNVAMFEEPGHPHVTLAQVVPGGTTADPFRTLHRWTAAGRGRVLPVSFVASDGAQLNGYLFEPPASVTEPASGYPGIVITTGSIQGYQQLYFWAAEGLAEAGYMVLTYDVQGQGGSDTLPANCAPSLAQLMQQTVCPGVPYQQNYNFFQGTEDALNFFFSSPTHPYPNAANLAGSSPTSAIGRSVDAYNPDYADLNASTVGIAGHSLGASAVSQIGQCDPRVKAIVAWDNLAPATPCAKGQELALHTPALGFNSEYFFNPEPMTSVPDPHAKDQAYLQLAQAGVDTMQVALRSSMHLEYSYVPYILPASSLGERVAFYYTLTWFDNYLRGDRTGYDRLVSTRFDSSADSHAIGAGYFSPSAAAADPSDPSAGNVPYSIKDLPVSDRLSFYYESEYALTAPSEEKVWCSDMRAGCPATAPPTP